MYKFAKRLNPADSVEIIDILRGTKAVAKLCDCTPAAVSQWRSKGIPKDRLLFLRERFKDLAVMNKPEVREL